MPERIAIQYTGRVQGVGFRATVRSIASHMPVTGWVRNEPDGSVRMEAQGEAADLDKLRNAIRTHMENFISNEREQPLPVEESEKGFDIRFH